MRDSSNTFICEVIGIIILHFIIGFAWLVYKLTKKEDKISNCLVCFKSIYCPVLKQRYTNSILMEKHEESRYVKRTQKDYTMSFKLQIVQEVERGITTISQVKKEYGIDLTNQVE